MAEIQAPLLLTGFGPFPGVPVNPTEAVARRLDGERIGGRRVVAEVLRVSFADVARRVPQLWRAHAPAAGLHLGVAVGAVRLRVETRALRLADARQPDVEGAQPVQAALWAEPAPERLSGVDAAGLVAALMAAGLPARTSDDPGRYVCNAAYGHALGATGRPCVFLHVPPDEAIAERAARIALAWLTASLR